MAKISDGAGPTVGIAEIRAFEERYYAEMPDAVKSVVATKHEGLDDLYAGRSGDAMQAFHRAGSDMLDIANGVTGTHSEYVRYRREYYGLAAPTAVAGCLEGEDSAVLSGLSGLTSGPVQHIAFGESSIPAEFQSHRSGVFDRYEVYQCGWELVFADLMGYPTIAKDFYIESVRRGRLEAMFGALVQGDRILFDDRGMDAAERLSDIDMLSRLARLGGVLAHSKRIPRATKNMVTRELCKIAVSQRISFGQTGMLQPQ